MLSADTATLTSIVAVGLDGAIGIENRLPWRLRSDLRFFKQTTLDNIVIMGRKTYESVGGCLKGRRNIVLSHRASLFEDHEDCHHAHSVAETLCLRGKFPKKEAFIIGGALTYAEFAPYVDRYLVTVVNGKFPQADAFFDDRVIGDLDDWTRREVDVERLQQDGADEYSFTVIELRHKRPDQMQQFRQELVSGFHQKNHITRRKAMTRYVAAGATLDQILSLA